MQKEVARKLIKDKLERLDSDFIKSKSLIIQKKVVELDEYKKAKSVFLYKNFKSEVKTDYVLKHSLLSNKIVYLPKILNNEMKLVRVKKDTKFEKGAFGIDEPLGKIEDIKSVDVSIIPLTVADKNLNRIGKGKGYYDQFLNFCKTYIIGLAYSLQIIDNIIMEEHDIPLDMVVSENMVLKK